MTTAASATHSQNRTKRRILVALTCALVAAGAVGARQLRRYRARAAIELRWVQAYPTETWDHVRTGLAWSLSFLGADLPRGSLDRAIARHDDTRFRLDLAAVGFRPEAVRALTSIIGGLENSDEYRARGAIDLGRFLVLCLHSSWHYYQITGAEPTLQDFVRRRGLTSSEPVPIVHSGVALHERLLKVKACADAPSTAFLAEEGHGSSGAGTFHATFHEALAVQANGQLRFAIYDERGQLVPASPTSLGMAGKPGKCLWCHEISLLPLYEGTPDVPGFMPVERLLALLDGCGKTLGAYRAARARARPGEIDFTRTQDHTFAELLYISFMEPSKLRLRNEWSLPADAVDARGVGRLRSHAYPEFPSLGGALYDRSQVDGLAPYAVVKVPDSVREPSAYEPDLIADGAGRAPGTP